MLEQAKEYARQGRAVYVMADNIADARRLEMQCGATREMRIRFETPEANRHFDWENIRMIGAHSNCVVLVDHHAIEDRFARLLHELHRYDP